MEFILCLPYTQRGVIGIDLVPFANIINPHAIILSLRGKFSKMECQDSLHVSMRDFSISRTGYFVLMNLQTLLKQIHDITNLKSKM
jgi:hypothetical protein